MGQPSEAAAPTAPTAPYRLRLPDTRKSIIHEFSIVGHEGYIIVGLFENGKPGEIFITMAKEGSTISGLVDIFAIAMSTALQHGAPLEAFTEKLKDFRFEPSGMTKNPEIEQAKSIADYIARWLEMKFLPEKVRARLERSVESET